MGNNNPFINVQPLFPLNGTEGQVLAKKPMSISILNGLVT